MKVSNFYTLLPEPTARTILLKTRILLPLWPFAKLNCSAAGASIENTLTTNVVAALNRTHCPRFPTSDLIGSRDRGARLRPLTLTKRQSACLSALTVERWRPRVTPYTRRQQRSRWTHKGAGPTEAPEQRCPVPLTLTCAWTLHARRRAKARGTRGARRGGPTAGIGCA